MRYDILEIFSSIGLGHIYPLTRLYSPWVFQRTAINQWTNLSPELNSTVSFHYNDSPYRHQYKASQNVDRLQSLRFACRLRLPCHQSNGVEQRVLVDCDIARHFSYSFHLVDLPRCGDGEDDAVRAGNYTSTKIATIGEKSNATQVFSVRASPLGVRPVSVSPLDSGGSLLLLRDQPLPETRARRRSVLNYFKYTKISEGLRGTSRGSNSFHETHFFAENIPGIIEQARQSDEVRIRISHTTLNILVLEYASPMKAPPPPSLPHAPPLP